MTCFHPLVAERVKTFSQTFDASGKKFKKINILGSAENILDIPDSSGAAAEYFTIPCGRCIGCRIDKARDWSVRILCEASTCERSSWFLTLTYDNDHLGSLSLDKKDFQQFIKDLRNYLSYKYDYSIRYFGCGEYGDNSGRKHFHIIIFNLGDLDIKPRSSRNGYMYYESQVLSDLWSKGHVVIAELNLQTASYVAKYTLKKQGLKSYDDLGVQAPFIMMSSRPGIGYDYFIKYHEYLLNRPFIEVAPNPKKILCDHKFMPLPKYFKRLAEELYYYNPKLFNDALIEKNYKIKLTQEIYLKKDLKHILEDEELNLLAQQKRRKL